MTDLNYLVWAELKDEGVTPTESGARTEAELRGLPEKISRFVTDEEHGAWVLEDRQNGAPAGMILFRFRRRAEPEERPDSWLFRSLPDEVFPPDGRFCEVFALRVEPPYRRLGCASVLKNQMERVARERGVQLLYTHTELANSHVLELNRKLGYKPVRTGPIWDEILRVSLVKRLGSLDCKPDLRPYLGRTVTVTVDRPLGSLHPSGHPIRYEANYGFISGTLSGDGEPVDAYLLGLDQPVAEASGVVIAVIVRRDDIEDKLVVASQGRSFTPEQISALVAFQERFFDTELIAH